MNNMHWVNKPITKEQYETAKNYADHSAEQSLLAERIAGTAICCGYGLYGYNFFKGEVDGKEGYYLSMHIGDSCD